MNNIKDRFGIPSKVAEFNRVQCELASNRALSIFPNALAGIVDENLRRAQRRNTIDPEFSMRQLRYGLKSHSKLADLIEAKDGPGAEAHWKEHMIAAGKVWMEKVGPNSLVDLID